jgi:hypothetical protein
MKMLVKHGRGGCEGKENDQADARGVGQSGRGSPGRPHFVQRRRGCRSATVSSFERLSIRIEARWLQTGSLQ